MLNTVYITTTILEVKYPGYQVKDPDVSQLS